MAGPAMRICRHCGSQIRREGNTWILDVASLKQPAADWIASFPCYSNPQPCPRGNREPPGHPDCRKCEGVGTIAGQHGPALSG